MKQIKLIFLVLFGLFLIPVLVNGQLSTTATTKMIEVSSTETTIYKCSTELVNCAKGTVPQSYIGDDGCTKWKCIPQAEICPIGCTCEGDAITCPTTATKPMTPEINKTIVIVVESSVLTNLNSEIERFKQDIEKDTHSKVIINFQYWNDEFQLRSYLSDPKNSNNLVGAIFIGDIPYFKINSPVFGTFISDYPYWDLDINLKDSNNDKIIDEIPKDFLNGLAETEIWVGRIKPPNNQTSIQDLRNYFNRNHNYRTGQNNNSGLLIFNSLMIFEGGYDYANYLNEINMKILDSKGPYNLDDSVAFYENDSSTIKEKYVNHLNEDYEFAVLSFHGSPTRHQLSPSVGFESADIRNASPKILFYDIGSCSVGRFSEDYYAAGEYLFSGNGLLVIASTKETIMNVDYFPTNFFGLASGISFGESYKYQFGITSVILGDPSLRLRLPPKNPPVIKINKKVIDFGSVAIGEENVKYFNITNLADKKEGNDLIINSYRLRIFLNGEPHYTGMIRYVFRLPPPTELGTVSPGQSIQVPVSFIPDDIGLFTAELTLISNDPETPYYKIKLRGRAGTCPQELVNCAKGTVPQSYIGDDGCTHWKCIPQAEICPIGCTCVGDVTTCPTEGIKPIEARISSESGIKTVSIEKAQDKLSIKSGGITVITTEKLVIEENKLSLKTSTGNKEIKILPEVASFKATAVTKVNTIELKEESQQPIYSVRGTKQAKLLFVIPVSMQIETKVSAESGNVISVKNPWWSFLAW